MAPVKIPEWIHFENRWMQLFITSTIYNNENAVITFLSLPSVINEREKNPILVLTVINHRPAQSQVYIHIYI